MTAWVVRGGRKGEFEEAALDTGVLTPGFGLRIDLSDVRSEYEVKLFLERAGQDEKKRTISAWAWQIWAFKDRIKRGDLIVIPRKGQLTISVGEMAGEYEYHPEFPETVHGRAVRWINREVLRDYLALDLQRAMNLPRTIYRVKGEDAELRLRAISERG